MPNRFDAFDVRDIAEDLARELGSRRESAESVAREMGPKKPGLGGYMVSVYKETQVHPTGTRFEVAFPTWDDFIGALRERSPGAVEAAIEILSRVDPATALPIALACASRPLWEKLWERTAFALARSNDPKAFKAMLANAHEFGVGFHIGASVYDDGADDALAALAERLTPEGVIIDFKRNKLGAEGIILYLGKHRLFKAWETIVRLWKSGDKDSGFRATLGHALMSFGDGPSLDLLEQGVRDDAPYRLHFGVKACLELRMPSSGRSSERRRQYGSTEPLAGEGEHELRMPSSGRSSERRRQYGSTEPLAGEGEHELRMPSSGRSSERRRQYGSTEPLAGEGEHERDAKSAIDKLGGLEILSSAAEKKVAGELLHQLAREIYDAVRKEPRGYLKADPRFFELARIWIKDKNIKDDAQTLLRAMPPELRPKEAPKKPKARAAKRIVPPEIARLMRRSRLNLERIVLYLKSHGYVFARPKHVLVDPVARDVDELEKLVGPLPLAVRAIYENVGGCDLTGSHPSFAFPACLALPGADEKKGRVWHTDPFVLFPVSSILEEAAEHEGDEARFSLPLAPDDYTKAGYSGGPCYSIEVPSRAVDPKIDCPHFRGKLTAYLGHVFTWGGFPGFERIADRPQQFVDELAALCEPIDG